MLLYHASHYLASSKRRPLLAIFGGFFGAYGVALFFALSDT